MIKKSKELSWLIRRHGLEMTKLSRASHIGAIFSVADIIAVLYADILKYDTSNPSWSEHDRMILSKGHAGASVYAALAESGFFNVEELKSHCQNGSRLSGHVSHYVPGVDFSTGSLGHGLSVGVGMAYAIKKDRRKPRVFIVIGDGECNEGAVWEAAMFAAHNRLNNLVTVVDYNKMQSMDYCEKTMKLGELGEKWRVFGWNVLDIDGHNHDALKNVLSTKDEDKPTVVIANTIKGYGVPYMENNILWHYRYTHDGWEYDQAVSELHKTKPMGVVDPYTLNGIEKPEPIPADADTSHDHTTSATWHPTWIF